MTMQSKETSDTSMPGAGMTRRGLLVGAAALGLSVLEVDALGVVVSAATPQTARTQASGTVYVEIDAGHNQEPITKYTPAMQKKFAITIKNGKRYALTYDGDILYVYYRRDLWNDPTEKKDFQKKYGYPLAPPKTWDQYLDQARFFNRPPHLHGTAFYGQRGFSYGWWANIWAGLGGHWFDARTMKTQINSPAGLKALNYLLEMKKVSPPDVLSYGYEGLRNAFFLGKFAMCVQWPDLHKKSFGGDPEAPSKIAGKLGSVPCPNGKSYMPYSRIGAISASGKNPDGANDVLWYLQQPAVSDDYVTDPKNGVDSCRYSNLRPENWIKRFPQYPALVTEYAKTMRANLLQGFPELSIPGAPTYIDKLDLYIIQALAGQIKPKVALDSAAREWESLTDSLDRNAQRQAYMTWISTFRK